ncbi:MAG: hypothetical protein AB7K67_01105 [Hyphomicrobiaceae bacterium]
MPVDATSPPPVPPQAQRPVPVWLGQMVQEGWIMGRPLETIADQAGVTLAEAHRVRQALGLPDRDHQMRMMVSHAPGGRLPAGQSPGARENHPEGAVGRQTS